MVRRSKTRSETESPTPVLTPAEMRAGISRLEKRIAELRDVDVSRISASSDANILTLENAIDRTLANLFGHNSTDYNRYRMARIINYRGISLGSGPSAGTIKKTIQSNISRSTSILEGVIAAFKEDLEEKEDVDDSFVDARDSGTRKVFVVHGRDDAVRETVARFLESIDMEPIILNEQVNRNRTIIEMIETFGDQAFC